MTILVTGSSGNLGRAVADRFLSAGHTVIGLDVVREGTPPLLESPLSKSGLSKSVGVDLGDEAATGAVIDDLVKEFGAIDVAVLTAGGFAMGSLADTDAASMKQQYELNFGTAYNTARPIFLHMMGRKTGRIFLVGSRPGSDMQMSVGMTAYGLSKSLIFRLAELMNAEAKGTGVVTTVIVPGIIDTPQNRAAMPEADHRTWMDPGQMAEIIHFYTTPAAEGLRSPVLKMYNNA